MADKHLQYVRWIGLFLILPLLIISNSVFSQKITVSGQIQDKEKRPVEFVNVIATSKNNTSGIRYDITNSEGKFTLRLDKAVGYLISVTSLSYEEDTLNFVATKDTIINFQLKDGIYNLDSIIIKEQRIPIRISGDTIIYNAGSFTAGDERKLKDVLNTMPGLEVTEEGGLKYKGVKVAKLLVEDKPFFGGNTKLGTDNIPADVVDQIEVIDKYSEIPFMKNMGIGDDLAVNVKLKKDKKNFIFGDITASGGVEKKYEFIPNLFYYSPKHSINSLNNMNNTFQQPLSFADIIQFEGGKNRLLNDGAGILTDIFSNFSNFLDIPIFQEKKVKFTSLNIVNDLSEKSKLESYLIYQKSNDIQSGGRNSTYTLDQNTTFEEIESHESSNGNDLLLGKIKLTHNTQKNNFYSLTYKFKYDNFIRERSQILDRFDNAIEYLGNENRSQYNHDFKLDLTKKYSSKAITNIQLGINYNTEKDEDLWSSNTQLLREFNDSIFRINQTIDNESYLFKLSASHFHSFNSKNQITFSLSSNLSKLKFSTNDEFLDEESSVLNLSSGLFNNALDFDLKTSNIGIEYKYGSSKRNITAKANGYYYTFSLTKEDNNRFIVVPKLELNQEIDNIGNLKLAYSYGIKLPSTINLIQNYYLTNSFTLRAGNLNASNTNSHSLSYNFRRYDIFNNFSFELTGKYQIVDKGNVYKSEFFGFEQHQTLIPINNLSNTFNTGIKIKKKLGIFNYEPIIEFKRNNFVQFLNNDLSNFTNKSIRFGLNITRAKRKKLKFKIKLDHAIFFFENFNGQSQYRRTRLAFNQNIKLSESLLLRLENKFEYYQNTRQENTFIPRSNIGIEYKIDKKWILECYFDNIFNVNKNVNSYQTDILVSDSFERIQSFFGIVKLNYTL